MQVVKICDFGVSKIIGRGHFIREQCGTPAYLAPEIIEDKGYEAYFPDIWSLGILLYAMVTGTVPFKAPNLQELHTLIIKSDFNFPSDISESVKDLMLKILKVNPRERLTFPEILAHPWMKEDQESSEDEESESSEDEDKKK
jgi:serine/threonine protein kinase